MISPGNTPRIGQRVALHTPHDLQLHRREGFVIYSLPSGKLEVRLDNPPPGTTGRIFAVTPDQVRAA